MITNFSAPDKHRSVLLVGVGERGKYLNLIVQPESFQEASYSFGDCALTESYGLLLDMGLDPGNLYTANIETVHDYLDFATTLANYEFSYIVPLDVNLADYFYDPMRNGARTYYLQYLIQQCSGMNHSVFLVTDESAELFEDIDAFLDDMNLRLKDFKDNALTNEDRMKVVFVANNLKDVSHANAALAGFITGTEVNEYPYNAKVSTQAVFDIDTTDKVNDMAFFRTHADGTTTVENLLNQYKEIVPEKIFTIFRILLYIGRELDVTEYIGTPYTPHKKEMIRDIVEKFLDSMVDFILRDYNIKEVYAEEDIYHPGTVRIVLKYEVLPIGCTERYIERMVQV